MYVRNLPFILVGESMEGINTDNKKMIEMFVSD